MDNKQKRKLLLLVYRTIFLFAFLALATTTYLQKQDESGKIFDIYYNCQAEHEKIFETV